MTQPSRVILALIVLLALRGTSNANDAIGPLEIKGTLYLSGVAQSVVCSTSAGNVLDSQAYNLRIMSLVPSCPLFPYTNNGELRFEGTDEVIIKNGRETMSEIFVGIATGPTLPPIQGALVADVVRAMADSVLKSKNELTHTGEKGELRVTDTIGYPSVAFIGTFKSTFPR